MIFVMKKTESQINMNDIRYRKVKISNQQEYYTLRKELKSGGKEWQTNRERLDIGLKRIRNDRKKIILEFEHEENGR